jgi:hypothetical protein
MSIRLIEPPPRAIELLRSVLDGFVVDGRYVLRSLRGKLKESITIEQAHPVHNIGLQGIIEKPGLDFELTAWRFLLIEEHVAVAAAELSVKAGSDIGFSSVTTGPYVASTAEAIANLSGNPEFQKHDWNMRLLRIPALYFVALWLQGISVKADRFCAVGPIPDFVEKDQVYSWNELRDRLVPAARQRIAAVPPSFQPQ